MTGLGGAAGCDACWLASDSSTRFLKSPASLFPNPLKPDWVCISQELSPFTFRTTELTLFWPIDPMPMEYVAVISALSMPKIPYFPELRSVSFTAGHNTVHATGYMSLCTLANAGPAKITDIKAATAIRLMSTFPSQEPDITIEARVRSNASRLLSLQHSPLGLLSPQQRPRQARRPARSINTYLRSGERQHLKPRVAHALIRFGVFFELNQALASEREHVACQRIALAVFNLNQPKPPPLHQFDGLDRQPRQIDQNSLLLEHPHH